VIEAEASTRDRLLAAGERLFAEKGLDGVSIRMITAAAAANTAAIHYHFGSKDGLVRAILERRAAELGSRRAELLDRIEADHAPTLRDVVAALVIPPAELAADNEHGGQHYVGFIAALVNQPELLPVVTEAFDEHTSRYLEALERVTPHLPPDVRAVRFALAKDLVNRALAHPGRGLRLWVDHHAPGARADLTDHLVDFLTGAFAAPAQEPGREVI